MKKDKFLLIKLK